MIRWPAEQQPLAPLFDAGVGKTGDGFIPCGVCSVRISETNRAVCPRRLLSFDAAEPSAEQRPLWDRVLQLAGIADGEKVRVWSEISLRDGTGLNYRLDYVLRVDERPPVIVEVMTASTSGGNKSKRTDMQSAFCDGSTHGRSRGRDFRGVTSFTGTGGSVHPPLPRPQLQP